MNRHAPDFDRNGLERLLSALAAEDRELQAAPQVRTAVMRTWDLGRPSIPHEGWARGRFAMMLASGSLAASRRERLNSRARHPDKRSWVAKSTESQSYARASRSGPSSRH
jgi:hypothetical protein